MDEAQQITDVQIKRQIDIPKQSKLRQTFRVLGWGVVFAILAWSWKGAEMRPLELLANSDNMVAHFSKYVPPDFRDWIYYMKEMAITIQIAVWGTALAIVFSVPFGLLSARNIVPAWVWQPIRRLMDVFRAVNEMVFALIFVAAIGLGPFAGVLALFVHTLGTLAKLFSEAVEAIDPRPVEGIRATGAITLEEIVYGIVPQVIPLWISFSLYRFEANVRSATVIGMVGAGGIGLVLWDTLRNFQMAKVGAMLLIIIFSVSVLDYISAKLRKMFT
jgi:phosphonate transport system permease protein